MSVVITTVMLAFVFVSAILIGIAIRKAERRREKRWVVRDQYHQQLPSVTAAKRYQPPDEQARRPL